MPPLSSEETKTLALQFLAVADAITDFRNNNSAILSAEQRQQLNANFLAVSKQGQDLLAASSLLAFEEAGTSLEKITEINSQIQQTLKQFQNIQKGIDIAAAVVTLGAAILSKNPLTVMEALKGVTESVTK